MYFKNKNIPYSHSCIHGEPCLIEFVFKSSSNKWDDLPTMCRQWQLSVEVMEEGLTY